jgi:hypothetical protein
VNPGDGTARLESQAISRAHNHKERLNQGFRRSFFFFVCSANEKNESLRERLGL